jgi:hypothetical protein
MTTTAIKPPAHLRAPTGRWYASVIEQYELESHHQKLLQAVAPP